MTPASTAASTTAFAASVAPQAQYLRGKIGAARGKRRIGFDTAGEVLDGFFVVTDEAVGDAEPVECVGVGGVEFERTLEVCEDLFERLFADPFHMIEEVAQRQNGNCEAVRPVDRKRLFRESAASSSRRPLVAEAGAVLAAELVYRGADRQRVREFRINFDCSCE